MLNKWSPEVEARVFEALEDNYYEVRAQAARTMGHFADRIIQKQAVTERLMTLLKDRSFEMVREVVLALGSVGSGHEVAKALLALREHHYWQVRDAGKTRGCDRSPVAVNRDFPFHPNHHGFSVLL